MKNELRKTVYDSGTHGEYAFKQKGGCALLNVLRKNFRTVCT